MAMGILPKFQSMATGKPDREAILMELKLAGNPNKKLGLPKLRKTNETIIHY